MPELEILARHDAKLLRGVDVLGRRAEVRHPLFFGKIPQRAAAVDERRAVEQHQRCPRGQAGHEPVPHHPATRREVEQAVAGLQVAVQQVLLDVLEQRAACAVDDAFGDARRARRIQDVDGMVERQTRKFDRTGGVRREVIVPAYRTANSGEFGDRTTGTFEIRHDDHLFDRRQPGDDLGHLVRNRQRLAVVPVAVDGKERAWLDLAEAVEHAAHAEIRRAGRPDRAEGRRPQHRDDRLGKIGDISGDPVAGGETGRAHRGSHPRCHRRQLRMRDMAAIAILAAEHEGVRSVFAAARREEVLGEIEACVGKPARPRHLVSVDERTRAALADDAGVVPDRAPECFALVVRPSP